MEKRLLITGFEPFGGSAENPSWMAVSRLPEKIGGFTLRKCVLPTVFGEAAERVLEEAQRFEPHVILCIGVAVGRGAITPERVAVNIRDARIADNRGKQPEDVPIAQDGPAAYFATVPVKAMVRAMQETGILAAVSNTAGTFVCNDTFYLLLHHFSGTSTRVGFVHVPALPQQHEVSMSLEDIVSGLTAAITACE